MTIPQALQFAVQHHQSGRLAAAERIYRQILAAQPEHAEALQLLGLIAQQAGRHEVAVELIRKAIALDPNNSDAHANLGQVFRASGRLDEAVDAYRRALQARPDFADIHNNLGVTLAARGRREEALAAYRVALELRPDFVEAHNNLGNALREGGQLDEAVAAYRRALRLKPDVAEIHGHLGSALREQGKPDEAIASCRRALELKPDYPEALDNLGSAFVAQARFDEAIAAYRRALDLRPDYPEAQSNLGAALAGQGLLDEAIAEYRRALARKPDYVSAHSNLIFTLQFHPSYDARTIGEERQLWNRRFGDPVMPWTPGLANDRDPGRRLRIGYVSPDFRDHVAGRNLIPLFARHDHRHFEIFCYSGVAQPDGLTDEFRRGAHQWRSTIGVGDEALAGMIRADGVDILVDLAQHTAGNRLTMFARKPAPVQVSFAGYPESSGLDAIQYRISDRFLEAGSAEKAATAGNERVLLIDSFWCYDPCGVEMEVNGLPASENGKVTFGCLNNFCKINERTLKLWSRVLGKVKGSRMLMRSPGGSHRQRTLKVFEQEGIEDGRVEFVKSCPRRQYLEWYHRVDIVLDNFPYNGHTTSLDALWMGAPVVSLVGETPVSRAGFSQLNNLRLSEMAADSEDDYVRIAVDLAQDLPRLAHLRKTLRDRMKTSVLMDAARFARNVEAAYRTMWQRWCEAPTAFSDLSDLSET